MRVSVLGSSRALPWKRIVKRSVPRRRDWRVVPNRLLFVKVTLLENLQVLLTFANRVTGPEDLQLIHDTVAPQVPVFVVPDDPAVARADEEGSAPTDTAAGSPGVLAVEALARSVAERLPDRPQG